MKVSLMSKVRAAVADQLQVLHAIGAVLNRPIDTNALVDLGFTLDNETRKAVENIITGNTVRIRALRDMAKLAGKPPQEIDTKLLYVSLSDTVGYNPRQTPIDPRKVYILEMIRLWLMTFPEKNEENGYCLDLDALVKQKRFLFHVIDWCHLMADLGEENYIILDSEISVQTGQITVKRFLCPSEDVDYALAQYDQQNRIQFDDNKIFEEYFGRLYAEGFGEAPQDLDLASYKDAFDNAPVEKVQDNRRFIIHYGSKNNVGQYFREHYTMWAYEEKRTLLRIENPGTDYPQRENISPYAVIPWMVACMSLDLPEETNFLVQYDQEEKSVVIIPGDPYAEPDSLAEVLPGGGAEVPD
jgi:hypothetical protein